MPLNISSWNCNSWNNNFLCFSKIMKNYNKLVRDKIPSIIEGKGETANTHIADDKEFEEKLHAKLKEEVEEFLEDESLEELADVMEVIYKIIEVHKFSMEEVERVRIEKKLDKGGFENKIILDSAD